MKTTTHPEVETEVKFHLVNPNRLKHALELVGAILEQDRIFEVNLRYDTPERSLSSQAKVLRLRQDEAVHLTYKGSGQIEDGALSRQEIEFIANDFLAAKHFLEALGYEVMMTYEKFRSTYTLGELLITMDEMPFGYFSEIEGPDAKNIQKAAILLGLDWKRRINASYSDIFRLLKVRFDLAFSDLNFENFKNLTFDLSEINIYPADK